MLTEVPKNKEQTYRAFSLKKKHLKPKAFSNILHQQQRPQLLKVKKEEKVDSENSSFYNLLGSDDFTSKSFR